MTRALSELREQVAKHAVNHADPGRLEILIDRATLLALIDYVILAERPADDDGNFQHWRGCVERLRAAGWTVGK